MTAAPKLERVPPTTTARGAARDAHDAGDGAAMAAILAAGIGAATLGLLVLLSEAGVYSSPSLYAPAGGLSGRSTFAVIAWLVAWFLLHRAWRARSAPRGAFAWTLGLVAFAVVATFPPVWSIFG